MPTYGYALRWSPPVAVAITRATVRTFRARRERAEDAPQGELGRMLREALAFVQAGC